MSDKSTENTNDVTITTKIYPTAYKNRKGFRVGNMKIKFDTKNSTTSASVLLLENFSNQNRSLRL